LQLKIFDKFIFYDRINAMDFDLQLFATPEEEGRTEQPTQRKLERARRRGFVARTIELSPVLVTLTTSFLLSLIGFWTFSLVFKFIYTSISEINSRIELTSDKLLLIILSTGIDYIKIVGPIMLCALLVSLLSEIAQVGLYFSYQALSFDLSKLTFNFSRLWQRLIPSTRSIIEYSKTIFKIIVISYFAYSTIIGHYNDIVFTMTGEINAGFFLMTKLAYEIMIKTAIFLAIMALLDYLYQRFEYTQSLKMTRYELKDEWKQMEGDPLIRARIRERQRQMAARRMMAEVAKADVVITNPVHIAVAIKYDSSYMSAPAVVAKGESFIAEKIIAIARENAVPIVENKPLAEALYKAVDIGEEIRPEFYQAVAEVLAFVMRLKRRVA